MEQTLRLTGGEDNYSRPCLGGGCWSRGWLWEFPPQANPGCKPSSPAGIAHLGGARIQANLSCKFSSTTQIGNTYPGYNPAEPACVAETLACADID